MRSGLGSGRKLTDTQVQQIRALAAKGETRASIAQQFGVRASHVSQIVLGRSRTGPKAASRGEVHYMARLNERAVQEIRALGAAGVLQPRLADWYDIDQSAISRIIGRRQWAHVKDLDPERARVVVDRWERWNKASD